MIRILHVVTTMDFGGVETLLMSIYRNIDREKIQFDFLCMNTCDNMFSPEIKKLGGKMFSVPFISRVGYFGYKRELLKFFKSHPEYKIVHSHINSYNGLVLEAAKKAGIDIRISHAHAVYSKVSNPIKRQIMEAAKGKIEKNATYYFACSAAARDSFYFKKENIDNCVIIKNGIETARFSFSEESRRKIRKENEIEDRFVIGQVGRFDNVKNQLFSIKVFEELIKTQNNIRLWFIGEGPEKEKVEIYVKEHGLDNNISFLGLKNNVPEFLAAMDVMFMPSITEGFGITAIEAQCSGLQVIASPAVPKETELTDRISYLDLEVNAWVKATLQMKEKAVQNRIGYDKKVREAGYDIVNIAQWLQSFYLQH